MSKEEKSQLLCLAVCKGFAVFYLPKKYVKDIIQKIDLIVNKYFTKRLSKMAFLQLYDFIKELEQKSKDKEISPAFVISFCFYINEFWESYYQDKNRYTQLRESYKQLKESFQDSFMLNEFGVDGKLLIKPYDESQELFDWLVEKMKMQNLLKN